MEPTDKSFQINDSGATPEALGERLAIRTMLAGIISYQAATSASESMSAQAIVAEMKRIIWTVIESLNLEVKSVGDDRDPLVVEEEIRRAALNYLETAFAFVKV
jgi:hypothetical protein